MNVGGQRSSAILTQKIFMHAGPQNTPQLVKEGVEFCLGDPHEWSTWFSQLPPGKMRISLIRQGFLVKISDERRIREAPPESRKPCKSLTCKAFSFPGCTDSQHQLALRAYPSASKKLWRWIQTGTRPRLVYVGNPSASSARSHAENAATARGTWVEYGLMAKS